MTNTNEDYDFTPKPLPARSDYVTEDIYTVKLVDVSARRQEISRFDDLEHTYQDYVFEIISGAETGTEFAGKKLAYSVNPLVNMGYEEAARKSKLWKVCIALLNLEPAKAGKFTSAQLLGRTCKIVVREKIAQTSGREYSVIESFMVDKKQTAFVVSSPSKHVENPVIPAATKDDF